MGRKKGEKHDKTRQNRNNHQYTISKKGNMVYLWLFRFFLCGFMVVKPEKNTEQPTKNTWKDMESITWTQVIEGKHGNINIELTKTCQNRETYVSHVLIGDMFVVNG